MERSGKEKASGRLTCHYRSFIKPDLTGAKAPDATLPSIAPEEEDGKI